MEENKNKSLWRIDENTNAMSDYLRGIERWLFIIALCAVIAIVNMFYMEYKIIKAVNYSMKPIEELMQFMKDLPF